MLRLLSVLALGLALAPASVVRAIDAEEEHRTDVPAHEAGHGGVHGLGVGLGGVNTSPAEFKSDLAIFTFFVFLLLLAILWKFAWGPISAGLEKREHGIAEHIAAAQRSHEEAKRLLAEYERKLASAQDD